MLNKFFREYDAQKQQFLQDRAVNKDDSRSLKVLSQNDDILRDRVLRTFFKNREKKTYNFTNDDLKKYLLIHQAILPQIITQNNYGDFILLFGSINEAVAFKEGFKGGIEINGTPTYFGKVRETDLDTTFASIKTVVNKSKKKTKKLKQDFIHQVFPRDLDDKSGNLGGLLQASHTNVQCQIKYEEIFHENWYKESLVPFEFKPHATTLIVFDEMEEKKSNDQDATKMETETEKEKEKESKDEKNNENKDENTDDTMTRNKHNIAKEFMIDDDDEDDLFVIDKTGGDADAAKKETSDDVEMDGNNNDTNTDSKKSNKKNKNKNKTKTKKKKNGDTSGEISEKQAYVDHICDLNNNIWMWYYNHTLSGDQMKEISAKVRKLLSIVQSSLCLPAIDDGMNRMFNVFGSISYGLYIHKYSDIDIGVLLNCYHTKKTGGGKKNQKKGQNRNKVTKFLQIVTKKVKNMPSELEKKGFNDMLETKTKLMRQYKVELQKLTRKCDNQRRNHRRILKKLEPKSKITKANADNKDLNQRWRKYKETKQELFEKQLNFNQEKQKLYQNIVGNIMKKNFGAKNNKYQKKHIDNTNMPKNVTIKGVKYDKFGGRDFIIDDLRLTATVPLLVLYSPQLKVKFDISINNNMNYISKLLASYVGVDARVRPFLMAIKYWAYQRNIYDSYKGYLGTIGWVLLGIRFLQIGEGVPILPIMKLDLASGNVLKSKHSAQLDSSMNKLTVGELLGQFFQYYSEFDWNKEQISILTREKVIAKNEAKFQTNSNRRRNNSNSRIQVPWIIEHPLYNHVNVARNVRRWQSFFMKKEIQRAADIVTDYSTKKPDNDTNMTNKNKNKGKNQKKNKNKNKNKKKNKTLTVWQELTCKAQPSQLYTVSDPSNSKNCLLISNLRYDVTEQMVRSTIGRIASPLIVQLSKFASGRHTGKAFVAFEKTAQAHSVMAELNETLLLGRKMFMKFASIDSMEQSLKQQSANDQLLSESDSEDDNNNSNTKNKNKNKNKGKKGKKKGKTSLVPIKFGGKKVHLRSGLKKSKKYLHQNQSKQQKLKKKFGGKQRYKSLNMGKKKQKQKQKQN